MKVTTLALSALMSIGSFGSALLADKHAPDAAAHEENKKEEHKKEEHKEHKEGETAAAHAAHKDEHKEHAKKGSHDKECDPKTGENCKKEKK